MICLNMCELMTNSSETIFSQWSDFLTMLPEKSDLKRIYIGSSFCSQYFLRMNPSKVFESLCKMNSYSITLVIPVFSQKDLNHGKEKIQQLLSRFNELVDEITVNDYGMLYHIRSSYDKKINLGRLFFKDQRDCRVPSYSKSEHSPSLLSIDNFGLSFDLHGIELDPTNEVLNLHQIAEDSLTVSVHTPYCYMTTGNICKFASIHQPIENKFRPNTICSMECSHITERYFDTNRPDRGSLIRIGRTLYFLQPSIKTIGRDVDRYIYFPAKEIQQWKETHK